MGAVPDPKLLSEVRSAREPPCLLALLCWHLGASCRLAQLHCSLWTGHGSGRPRPNERAKGALRNILAVLGVRLFERHKHVFEGPHEGNALSQSGFVVCGAMTRGHTPCKRAPVSGRGRCRLHGGLSTGPKTPQGRQRCAKAAKARRRRL